MIVVKTIREVRYFCKDGQTYNVTVSHSQSQIVRDSRDPDLQSELFPVLTLILSVISSSYIAQPPALIFGHININGVQSEIFIKQRMLSLTQHSP